MSYKRIVWIVVSCIILYLGIDYFSFKYLISHGYPYTNWAMAMLDFVVFGTATMFIFGVDYVWQKLKSKEIIDEAKEKSEEIIENAKKEADKIIEEARYKALEEQNEAKMQFEDYRRSELEYIEKQKRKNNEFIAKKDEIINKTANLVLEYYVKAQKLLLTNQKILRELYRKRVEADKRVEKKFLKLQNDSLQLVDEIITDEKLREVFKQKILSYDPVPETKHLAVDEYGRLILAMHDFWQILDANLAKPAIPSKTENTRKI